MRNPDAARNRTKVAWLFEPLRNRVNLLSGQNRAGHSSSARSLRQLHTSAGILFQPTAIVRPSQRESKNDPHGSNLFLADSHLAGEAERCCISEVVPIIRDW
jgi:hypothetical protein